MKLLISSLLALTLLFVGIGVEAAPFNPNDGYQKCTPPKKNPPKKTPPSKCTINGASKAMLGGALAGAANGARTGAAAGPAGTAAGAASGYWSGAAIAGFVYYGTCGMGD